MWRRKKYATGLLVAIIGLLLLPSVRAGAAETTTKASTSKSSSTNITQAVTQSYNADANVQLGMIVKLKDKDSSSVEPLSQNSIKGMLGVIVSPNDSSVTIAPQSTTKQQVYVATSGRFSALVSNQNGPINSGDYVSISAVDGIGMKTNELQSIVLGKAMTSFNGTGNVIGKVSLKDSLGKTSQVSIGRVVVTLDIASNPLATQASHDYVPNFLSKAAVTVANKPVSAARIYLGGLTLLVTAFVAANLVYSGVRNGMVAIGRNPLSRKTIMRSLIQTVTAGLIIFVVGVFAVYLLLKL